MGQIRDIMEKNVITIEHDKSSLDAAKLISEKDISFLVVVKDGKPRNANFGCLQRLSNSC